MTVRTRLIADLARELDGRRFVVKKSAKSPDRLEKGKATLLVQRDSFAPWETAKSMRHEFTLALLDPQEIDADEDLEDSTDELVAVLDGMGELHWTAAERGVYAEQWHCYLIKVSLITTYKEK